MGSFRWVWVPFNSPIAPSRPSPHIDALGTVEYTTPCGIIQGESAAPNLLSKTSLNSDRFPKTKFEVNMRN